VTYSAFQGSDTAENSLTGTLSYTCSYAQNSDVGNYTITPSGLSAANYDITYVSGTLAVTEAAQTAPTSTAITIDYANETVTFGTEYELRTDKNDESTAITSGSAITPGSTYSIRLKEKANYNASDWTDITLSSRPAAPTGLTATAETSKAQANGTITGLDNTMEYRIGSSDTWTAITGTTLTDLSAGTYYVRVAATDSTFHGSLTTVTIGEGDTLTVTLNSNGGSTVSNIAGLSYNDPAGTLPTPTRTGYKFNGWYNGTTQLTATTQITANVTYTAQWTTIPYTLTFSANGGTGSMEGLSMTYDLAQDLPQNTFTRQGYYFSGWSTTLNGSVAYGDGQSVKNLTTVDGGSVTLFAQWTKNPTYAISGTVVNGENATVSVIKGSETLMQTTCDSTGGFDVSGIESGAYNLVATSADGLRTVTSLVTLSDGDKSGLELKLPEESVNSVLNVEKDTPAVVVGQLDTEAQAVKDENAGSTSVTVTMTVEAKEDVTDSVSTNPDEDTIPDEATEKLQTAQTAIKETAGDVSLTFLEITVEKTVTTNDQTTTETMSDTTNMMEIIVPFDMSGKEDVAVYRYHNGVSEALKLNPGDGEEGFVVGSDSVTVYAQKFSTYAIGYTVVEEDGSAADPGIGSGSDANPNPDSSIGSGSDSNIGTNPNPSTNPDPNTGTNTDPSTNPDSNTGTNPDPSTDPIKDPLVTPVVPSLDPSTDQHDCPSLAYADVDVTEWYHEAIDYAILNQLMVGYNGLFEPDSNLTRAMMAQILYNREGRPAATTSSIFPDVAYDRWYATAISWAAKSGVVIGYDDGTFQPDGYITREQLATMLWRYAGAPTPTQQTLDFQDADQVSSYARQALLWANENGIVIGKGSGILDPKGQAKRSEVAQMMMNFLRGKDEEA
jgi:uncharacterized repeat protein (TIGR02543 family)